MSRFGFCGSGYTPKSLIADSQRLVNLYPEVIQSGLGRGGAQIYLIGTPGLKEQYNLTDGPSRGLFTIPHNFPSQDRSFTISGGTLYELLAPPNKISRGTVVSDGYPIFFATNTKQLAVTSNGKLYILDLITNVFSGPIIDTEGNVLNAASVVYSNGFFLVSNNSPIGAPRIQFSAVFDGLVWDPLDALGVEASSGSTCILLTIQNTVWAFGDDVVQPFQVTTDPDNPFQPIESGVIHIGLGAAASLAILNNSPIWLGRDMNRGGTSIWTAEGWAPVKISNTALDTILSSYNSTGIQLAYAFAFSNEGHSVYQISFPDPSINTTWRYDSTLPRELAWYEVGKWNSNSGLFEAHQSATHSFAFGMHLVGSLRANADTTFSVSEMSTKYNDDNGILTRRARRSPHLSAEQLYLFFQKLEIVAEAGLGLDGSGQGSDPQIMIRWSDNGGKTWKNEVWLPLGKIGEFRRRVRLWRLGRSLDRVFEVVYSEPAPIRLIDGFVKYTVGKE